MITLGHVNIRTARLEETCSFYERLLGFRRGVAATNPDPERNIWLHDALGNPSVHINVFRPGEEAAPGERSCLDHIAFNCPDRTAMAALLEREGMTFTVVETRVPGLIQFNLRDPNGVRVELTFGHERVQGVAAPPSTMA